MESTPPSAPELAETLGALLRSTYRRLQHRLYSSLEKQFPDIRRAHSAVFRHITDDGSRLTDLADQAEMTKQSMAYLVGYLEEHGYVRTGKHPNDGRAVLVKLTAKGRRFIDAALAASRDIEDTVRQKVGAAQLAQARQTLALMSETLAEAD